MTSKFKTPSLTTRRGALKTLGLGAGAAASLPLWARYAGAQTSEPIKIGFQMHGTGIGATYGRWYDRATAAATKLINDAGGINGRRSRLSPRMMAPTPNVGPKLSKNSPRSMAAMWRLGPCSATL